VGTGFAIKDMLEQNACPAKVGTGFAIKDMLEQNACPANM